MANSNNPPEAVVREIKRKSRKVFNAEQKIRIVLEGLRGEQGISAVCRREGIHTSQYYKRSKEFLEVGKRRLAGDEDRNPGRPCQQRPCLYLLGHTA